MRINFSKMVFIASLMACFSITAFAQDGQGSPQNTADQKAKVQRLIRDGVKRNKEEIQREAFYLSVSDKEYLYDKNKKRGAGGYAALDFFVGFGFGSYIQGDKVGGITQSAMDLLGWGLMFTGISLIDEEEACGEEGDKDCPFLGGTIYLLSGIGISIASRVCSWIFPFSYQKKYNRTLDAALNSNKVSYSIDPLLIPKEGVPAAGLAFNLRF